jgi:uncharacterized protein YqfB (UPF0267 family)
MNSDFILSGSSTIVIHDESNINPLFIRVNSYLLNKYFNDIEVYSNQEKLDFLISCWKQEFDVDVLLENLKPKFLKFKNNNELMLFLIRIDAQLS